MTVVILAGGLGTRLSEYTNVIPKPMVPVGDKPLIWHIMSRFAKYGHTEFVIALGYRGEIIKQYFLNYRTLNSNFTLDMSDGKVTIHDKEVPDWTVTLIDTGQTTQTGGRLRRLKEYLGNQPFMLTYGDGVADVDIDALIQFHEKQSRLVTVTAVHPGARFGELQIDKEIVTNFAEKPQIQQGWINGGFFVMQPEFIDYIENDATILEREPLESIAHIGDLAAYSHEGFWHCVDTKRDLEVLEKMWTEEKAVWLL